MTRYEAIVPTVPAQWTLLAAMATAVGVLGSGRPIVLALAVGVIVVCATRRKWSLVAAATVFLMLGSVSGLVAATRLTATVTADVPQRSATLVFRLVEDESANAYGISVGEPLSIDGASWSGPRLAIVGLGGIEAGATVEAFGRLRPGTRRVRDEVVAGTMDIVTILNVDASMNPLLVVGNSLRSRVQVVFDGSSSTDGLITGFLIGDTRRLSARDVENLRRSGLAHFVAVSGSNVAVFMLGWWIVAAPLAVHPRARAIIGAIGLGVFIVVTRWEPSVVRASAMTAVPLFGSVVGIPVDPWMALGVAVTTLLLVSGDLLGSVGFQLSVAATAGVLVGVGLARGRKPAWLWTSLFVTVAAQLAVAPIVIIVFGTMPLLAPVANLLVAPLVTIATVAGGLSLVGGVFEPVAAGAASAVLMIARLVASGPQLGGVAIIGVVLLGATIGLRFTRPLGVAIAVLVAGLTASGPSPWPTMPTMTVLDIGQGDAILLRDPGGRTMLIDGGPSPRLIDQALRRQAVSRIDVVVATHGDADHVAGLIEVVTSYEVGEVWVSRYANPSDLLANVIAAASAAAIPVRGVAAGHRTVIGGIAIEVLSPSRRYASDNDGSIVILARSERSALIPGDIEAIGQAELPRVKPDILVVPHHGSSSSSARWIGAVVGSVAVLSYGLNTYGHPDGGILAQLRESGVQIRETFSEGDVAVTLSGSR
ncbi:MAG: ComEC/Rec2 family competence protein [Actinomycetia bacterium]|nr:ComEC/Rec2 family competence protein [Actinomycetes bacterium]